MLIDRTDLMPQTPSLLELRRRNLGLTQDDVAAVAGLGQGMLSKYENGQTLPTLPIAVRLTIALRCSLDELANDLGLKSAYVMTADEKGVQKKTHLTLPDIRPGVGLPLQNKGASVHADSVQADPLQSRADLQRTYNDINATINTLIDVRLRLSAQLGREDDGDDVGGAELSKARMGGPSRPRDLTDASGRQKAASGRRARVR